MKLVEDNIGLFPGETGHVSVCSKCGCRKLFKQVPSAMYRLKKCPQCGHTLDWSKKEGVQDANKG